MMRVPWFLLGYIVGVLSMDEDTAAIAFDLGVWTRAALGL